MQDWLLRHSGGIVESVKQCALNRWRPQLSCKPRSVQRTAGVVIRKQHERHNFFERHMQALQIGGTNLAHATRL